MLARYRLAFTLISGCWICVCFLHLSSEKDIKWFKIYDDSSSGVASVLVLLNCLRHIMREWSGRKFA